MQRTGMNIENGTLVLPEGCRRGSIAVRDGKIAQIAWGGGVLPAAGETVDAEGLLIFPGVIDSHTHIRGGAFSYREDFYTGSCAAAAGGVTTFLEMPGSALPASTPQHFKEKLADMRAHIGVDAALYGGAGYDNLEQIPLLAQAGAVAFKTFLMPPVPGREREFYGMCAQDDGALCAVMEAVARTGLTLTLHCEDSTLVERATAQVRRWGGARVQDYCDARPPEAEITAVRRAIACAERTHCRINIAHVSTPEAARMIAEARTRGVDAAGETCAQYLTFDRAQMDAFGPYARMKPPFRDRARVDALVRAYADGMLSYTGSDHAPFTPEEKTGGGSIWDSFDGLAGIEMTLPLLLELAEAGALNYETIAANTAEHTAQRFGLTGKGRLQEGCDADLVLVRRLEQPRAFRRTQLHGKWNESGCIYEGVKLHYTIEGTLRRGEMVYSHGAVSMAPGSGKLLKTGGEQL